MTFDVWENIKPYRQIYFISIEPALLSQIREVLLENGYKRPRGDTTGVGCSHIIEE